MTISVRPVVSSGRMGAKGGGMTILVRPSLTPVLFALGATTSVVAAQLIISQVCNGRRRSGFGYYWEFPHRGRPMTLETRKKRR